MQEDTSTDAYYGNDDLGDDEIDLSFLDDKKDQ